LILAARRWCDRIKPDSVFFLGQAIESHVSTGFVEGTAAQTAIEVVQDYPDGFISFLGRIRAGRGNPYEQSGATTITLRDPLIAAAREQDRASSHLTELPRATTPFPPASRDMP